MTQQPPIAEGLQQVMGASATPSGSRASTEPSCTVSAASGFDPSRGALLDICIICEGQGTDRFKVQRVYRIAATAIAMEARQGGDAKQAPSEGRQRGPQGIAQAPQGPSHD